MFKNLKYSQLKALIKFVNETKNKKLEVIRQRFVKTSKNFNESKGFLKKLNILDEKNEKLTFKNQFKTLEKVNITDNFLKNLLLKELLNVSGQLYGSIKLYLDNFQSSSRGFEYTPSASANIKESWLRNLLIELRLIDYYKSSGAYFINPEYFNLFEINLKQKKLKPEELTKILKNKENLGYAAELEVLKLEKKYLAKYPKLLKKIEHISQNNVLAGYDILSWETKYKNGKPIPKYIEVKAVSNDSCFFWSRNEIETAKNMAQNYYLYLLPVISDNKFDINNIIIIQNPIANVFNNSKYWLKKVETYSFSKKHK